MNDVLIPVGKKYGANLVTGIEFQSITGALSMLSRTRESRKPARIFYISDFGSAGEGMSIATARQLEYWARDPDVLDIKLEPLALTREQVVGYKLPRTPIKETDLRRRGFEDRHGEGAVELDALEALYPGGLAKLVEAALTRPILMTPWKKRLRRRAARPPRSPAMTGKPYLPTISRKWRRSRPVG